MKYNYIGTLEIPSSKNSEFAEGKSIRVQGVSNWTHKTKSIDGVAYNCIEGTHSNGYTVRIVWKNRYAMSNGDIYIGETTNGTNDEALFIGCVLEGYEIDHIGVVQTVMMNEIILEIENSTSHISLGYYDVSQDLSIPIVESEVEETYIITFDSQGGVSSLSTKYANSGVAIGTLPTCAKSGYILSGWYDEDGNKVTSSTVFNYAEDITLYAHWDSDELILRFYKEEGSADYVDKTYHYGDGGVYPTASELGFIRRGYSLVKWDGNVNWNNTYPNDSVHDYPEVEYGNTTPFPTGNIFYGLWERNDNNVTIEDEDGNLSDIFEVSADSEELCELEALIVNSAGLVGGIGLVATMVDNTQINLLADERFTCLVENLHLNGNATTTKVIRKISIKQMDLYELGDLTITLTYGKLDIYDSNIVTMTSGYFAKGDEHFSDTNENLQELSAGEDSFIANATFNVDMTLLVDSISLTYDMFTSEQDESVFPEITISSKVLSGDNNNIVTANILKPSDGDIENEGRLLTLYLSIGEHNFSIEERNVSVEANEATTESNLFDVSVNVSGGIFGIYDKVSGEYNLSVDRNIKLLDNKVITDSNDRMIKMYDLSSLTLSYYAKSKDTTTYTSGLVVDSDEVDDYSGQIVPTIDSDNNSASITNVSGNIYTLSDNTEGNNSISVNLTLEDIAGLNVIVDASESVSKFEVVENGTTLSKLPSGWSLAEGSSITSSTTPNVQKVLITNGLLTLDYYAICLFGYVDLNKDVKLAWSNDAGCTYEKDPIIIASKPNLSGAITVYPLCLPKEVGLGASESQPIFFECTGGLGGDISLIAIR